MPIYGVSKWMYKNVSRDKNVSNVLQKICQIKLSNIFCSCLIHAKFIATNNSLSNVYFSSGRVSSAPYPCWGGCLPPHPTPGGVVCSKQLCNHSSCSYTSTGTRSCFGSLLHSHPHMTCDRRCICCNTPGFQRQRRRTSSRGGQQLWRISSEGQKRERLLRPLDRRTSWTYGERSTRRRRTARQNSTIQ